jgi:2,5-furandicarboxylate decarboxylase 1
MSIAAKDLRAHLANMVQRGECFRVEKSVDRKAEAPSLISSSIKRGKTILFENISGSDMPIVGNVIGSKKLLEQALDCEHQGLASWFGERSHQLIRPVCVRGASVQDVVEDNVDLMQLPIPTLHEEDAGPYITAGVCIQKDPETGAQNAGYYSLQLKGKSRLGLRMLQSTHGYAIFQKRLRRGLRTEMAVAIGLHPIEMLAAASHVPGDEFALAGGLRGEPVELVRCVGLDLEVPAHAEIILEGTILPDVMEPEGPIGDWLGYYPLVENRHIFEVERITRRHDAIFQTVLSGSAEENLLLSIPRTADVLRASRKAVPGVIGASLDPFLPICVIQLRKQFDGEPMNALLAALGEVPFIKIGIAVDEDVDLSSLTDVLWAVTTRTNLDEDINVIRNVMGFSRDPFDRYKSKMVIDATAPLAARTHFRRSRVANANIALESFLD